MAHSSVKAQKNSCPASSSKAAHVRLKAKRLSDFPYKVIPEGHQPMKTDLIYLSKNKKTQRYIVSPIKTCFQQYDQKPLFLRQFKPIQEFLEFLYNIAAIIDTQPARCTSSNQRVANLSTPENTFADR